MKRISNSLLPLLLLLATVARVNAQAENFGPCSRPAGWEKISMITKEPPAKQGNILIITNRPFVPDAEDGIIFPNTIAEYREVSYLVGSCNQGSWELFPVASFRAGMEYLYPDRDILLFVHGHGKSLPQVLTRSNQIREKYDVSLIVFDWPSMNSNFNKSLSRVRRCGENFHNLLLHLQQYREEALLPGQHMSLFLHSLGNYFLTHLVVNGNNQYMEDKIFDNIIMNAAAVRSKEHGEVLSRLRIQDRIYIASNENDRVLKGAHLLTSGRMLGNLAMEPLASNATYVDFTPVAGNEHTYFAGYHSFEFDLKAFGHFFDNALTGKEVDLSDDSLFEPGDHKRVYRVKAGSEQD